MCCVCGVAVAIILGCSIIICVQRDTRARAPPREGARVVWRVRVHARAFESRESEGVS